MAMATAITTMANEEGQHHNALTLTNNRIQAQINNELAADYFSGLTIQKLGGNLEETQPLVKRHATKADTVSLPSAEKQLNSIKEGWKSDCTMPNCLEDSQPVNQNTLIAQSWGLSELNQAQWTKDLGSVSAPIYAKAEVLLARHNLSTGAIRGNRRTNLMKAISAFQTMKGLQTNGVLNSETWAALQEGQTEDAYISYTLTQEDMNGPYVSIPTSFYLQSEMKGLFYTEVSEMLSEKFHMDEDFLKKLNPNATFKTVGEKIIVANPRNAISIKQPIALLIAHKAAKQLYAYNSKNQMIAAFPASYGAVETPSPSGRDKILSITPKPIYKTDLEPYFPDNLKGFSLPAGPNSPIGMMLISFENRVFGINGTPNPSTISLTSSGGEIRLTNWDVVAISKQLQPGVIVIFIEE